jgi:hypothetical protein
MTATDDALFNAASRRTLVRLLRKRGVFVGPKLTKEKLRPLFALGFGYGEFLELSKKKTS